MSSLIFIQKSRIGRKIFSCDGEEIEITFKVRSKSQNLKIALNRVSPDYTVMQARFHLLWVLPLLITAVLVSATWVLLNQKVFPHELAIWSGMYIPLGAWAIARGAPCITLVRFCDLRGNALFDVVRGENQAADFDDFVDELVALIKAKSNEKSA